MLNVLELASYTCCVDKTLAQPLRADGYERLDLLSYVEGVFECKDGKSVCVKRGKNYCWDKVMALLMWCFGTNGCDT